MNYSILHGDCRTALVGLPDKSVQVCVTSPPYYGLRDYGVEGQMGLEKSPAEYVQELVAALREVRRVLKDNGVLWLNLGDTCAASGGDRKESKRGPNGTCGLPSEAAAPRVGRVAAAKSQRDSGLQKKNILGIPWRVALALQDDGWILRQDIIWNKPNAMPESVRDRCTRSHEYIFLLTKKPRYYFDATAMREKAVGGQSKSATSFKRPPGNKREQAIPGQSEGTHRPDRADVSYDGEFRNRRSVWTVSTKNYKGAHFATFPAELITPCVLASTKPGDVVLDLFNGSGTTGEVALLHGRNYIGVELNQEYIDLTHKRLELVQAKLPSPSPIEQIAP